MKVLMIIPSMDPASGGTSQVIRNIIPQLQKLQIVSEVLCLDDPASSFIADDSFITHALGPASGPWRYSAQLKPWLKDNLHRFDVIVVHALWLYHGYGFYKAYHEFIKKQKHKSIFKSPRFYVMPHGMLDPYFQTASTRKLKALRNQLYWKLIENKLVNNAHGLLFTCKTELLLARQPFKPYQPKQELNVGLGIETPPSFEEKMAEAFYEKCPMVKGQRYILSISRIHEKKGIDHLIDAYKNLLEIQQEFSNSNMESLPKLVIAGPGLDTTFGKSLQQQVSNSGMLSNSVFFPGMLSGDAKWGAFYQSEVFILPSHQENFGIAVAESLACGRPVLISNQVNIWREIIEDGAGLVNEDTTAGTQHLLSSWFQLSAIGREAMCTSAKQSFEINFSIENVAKRFADMVIFPSAHTSSHKSTVV